MLMDVVVIAPSLSDLGGKINAISDGELFRGTGN